MKSDSRLATWIAMVAGSLAFVVGGAFLLGLYRNPHADGMDFDLSILWYGFARVSTAYGAVTLLGALLSLSPHSRPAKVGASLLWMAPFSSALVTEVSVWPSLLLLWLLCFPIPLFAIAAGNEAWRLSPKPVGK